jgi:hypothetical protein
MRAGVDVGPYVARVETVEVRSASGPGAERWVTLTQGRHRQLRRTCRPVGLKLVALHRLRVGPISVAGLGEGQWRSLTSDEVEALWQTTGGRARLAAEKLAARATRARRARLAGAPDQRLERWLAHTFEVSARLERAQ